MYRALASSQGGLTFEDLVKAHTAGSASHVERKITAIAHDFDLDISVGDDGVTRYRLGSFRGFTGQADHSRHDFVAQNRNRVS